MLETYAESNEANAKLAEQRAMLVQTVFFFPLPVADVAIDISCGHLPTLNLLHLCPPFEPHPLSPLP